MDSTNKTALITGGTKVIGKETAFSLSRKGINVTIVGQTNGPIFKVFYLVRRKFIPRNLKTELKQTYIWLCPQHWTAFLVNISAIRSP